MEEMAVIGLIVGAIIMFVITAVIRKTNLYLAYIDLLKQIADDRVTVRLRTIWLSSSDQKRRMIITLLSAGVFVSQFTNGLEDDELWRELEREITG